MRELVLWLTGSGAALEFLGLALVVRQVFADRRLEREIAAEERPSGPPQTVDVDVELPYPVEGRELSSEERLERLERRFREEGQKFDREQDELRDYINRLASSLGDLEAGREERVRGFLRDALGPFWKRLAGVILLFVGALLTAAGSIISAAAGG